MTEDDVKNLEAFLEILTDVFWTKIYHVYPQDVFS